MADNTPHIPDVPCMDRKITRPWRQRSRRLVAGSVIARDSDSVVAGQALAGLDRASRHKDIVDGQLVASVERVL